MLPYRRPCVVQTVPWNSEKIYLAFGYHPETGELLEVFGDGPKAGSDAWAMLHDICRSMSLEMQSGTPPEEFAHRCTRNHEDKPMSLYGLVADALVCEAHHEA